MSSVVSISHQQSIAIITIDNPPVNALSTAVRQGLDKAIKELEQSEVTKVIILQCLGKTFIAGADISEFNQAPIEPQLPEVVNTIEQCSKPVIAALFGTTLGGGFEVALGCHYRVALGSAKIGFPEVNLGLIPGAGGTQRIMRCLGIEKALELIAGGQHVSVNEFNDTSLFIAIVEDQLLENAIEFAKILIETNQLTPTRVSSLTVKANGIDWEKSKAAIQRKARGAQAPLVAWDILHKTHRLSFAEGLAYEREQFMALRASEQAKALRYIFNAERQSGKIKTDVKSVVIKEVAVIGGGNMGSGIATAFISNGFAVTLIEQNDSALQQGVDRIHKNIRDNVSRGRISEEIATETLSLLKSSCDYQTIAGSDLVIEAVFEDLEIKKSLFEKLDTLCDGKTIFATNTSYLDIDAIAAVTKRPEQVVGLHFFSPANIMKLLEIVRTKKTSDEVLVTATQLAKQLKKTPVIVGTGFGFAANRMYTRYGREIQQMLLEGAGVEQIDKAMTDWGMAMGPLAVQDMSGIDIGHSARAQRPHPPHDPGYFRPAALMVEAGRLGRKTSRGFYQYNEEGKPLADEMVEKLIRAEAEKLGIQQKKFTDEEIQQRALFALISESISIVNEGIVERVSDIDVIWIHGYGFPRYKGGPVFQAQMTGQEKISESLKILGEQYGSDIWPSYDVSAFYQ